MLEENAMKLQFHTYKIAQYKLIKELKNFRIEKVHSQASLYPFIFYSTHFYFNKLVFSLPTADGNKEEC